MTVPVLLNIYILTPDLVRGDVSEGVLRSMFHEDTHGRPDPHAHRIQPACQRVCQVVHLSEGERGSLPTQERYTVASIISDRVQVRRVSVEQREMDPHRVACTCVLARVYVYIEFGGR